MSSSTPTKGWSETLPVGSLLVSIDPVVSQVTPSPPIDPTATLMEHILATLARFEIRMNEQDRRIAATAQPSRPDPDPPYSLPPFNPTAVVAVSIPIPQFSNGIPPSLNPTAHPWRQPPVSGDTTDFTLRPPSGFRPSGSMGANYSNPNAYAAGPRAHGSNPYISRPPSTWDNPNARLNGEAQQWRNRSLSWDHPSARPSYGANGHDLSRQFKMDPPHFDESEAPSWISRIKFYFDHIMLPDDHRLHYVTMIFDPRLQSGYSTIGRTIRPRYGTNFWRMSVASLILSTLEGLGKR